MTQLLKSTDKKIMETSAFLLLKVYNMRGTVGIRKFSADWRIIRILAIILNIHRTILSWQFKRGSVHGWDIKKIETDLGRKGNMSSPKVTI
jgi:hypothetical protein